MLIHFPLAFENVLAEADALLEKNYHDHAIVLLENFLDTAAKSPGIESVQKKLLVCYLLKEDLDSAEAIILQLTAKNCLDLSTVAHHIIIAQWVRPAENLLSYYKDKLDLSPSSKANLLALTYELKEFYEMEWAKNADKLFQHFFHATDFEQALNALGSLEEVAPQYFLASGDQFQAYLNADGSRLFKVLLYFLLVEKCPEPPPTLENIPITKAMRDGFQETLAQGLSLVERLELDMNTAQMLSQHLLLCYHSLFPSYENLNQREILYWLGKGLLRIEFSGILEISGNLSPESRLIEQKVREYLASLSL